MMTGFLRSIQVRIIPYGNPEREATEDQIFAIESSGGYHEPRIKFDITKSLGSVGATATVEITNPGESLKSSFSGWGNVLLNNMGKKFVTVGCTYLHDFSKEQSKKQHQIFFTGTLIKAWVSKDGPEEILTLYLMESANASKRRIVNINNFNGTLQLCLSAIVGFLGGNGWDVNREGSKWIYDPKFVQVENTAMYNYTQSGTLQDVMDSLARDYNFTWWLERSETNSKELYFHACSDDQLLDATKKNDSSSSFVVSVSEGNLLAVTPEVDDLGVLQKGLTILCKLDPRFRLLGVVDLYSEVYPACNGKYKAIEIKYVGDTHGSDWTMEIRCFQKKIEEE